MAKNIYKPGTPTYARKGMLKSSLIAVGVLAFITVILAAIILPNYTVEQPPVDKTVEAIVVQNEGLISIDADLSNVFVTVKYTDGTQSEFSLNEAVITGLDTSKEQTLDNVILDIGGFKQKVTFNVVSSAKIVAYEAGQGGVIEGDTVQRVFAGYDGTTVFAVPDEGYEFLRWSDGNPNAIRTDRQVSRDMTLTATFTKKRYIVVFYYPDGTTASEETVFHNEAATKVPLPSEPEMYKYGHILTGWSEEYAHITQDTNIYPVYQKYATDLYLSFTQSVEGVPLGTVKDLKSYYPKEEASILRVEANPFRRFVGWTIETYSGSKFIQPVMIEGDYASYPIGSLTNYVNFFSSRTASTDEYTLTFTPTAVTEEIYIKANFEYETSNITFSTMGSTLSSIELPAGQPIGEVFDVQPALYFDSATREAYLASDDCPEYLKVAGYVFKGWYIMGTSTNPSTGYPEFVTNETTFTRPTALIAYWEKNIYQVVFLQGDNQDDAFKNLEWYNPLTEQSETYYDDDLGGLVLTVLYQDQLGGALTGAFPEATPYKQYYTFSGWYVASTGGVATEELVDKTYKVTRSLAIVPVFRVIQKTAEFTVYGSGSVIKVQDGSETSVPGTYRMDAVQDYTFRFVAGEGYSLNNIEVFNGIGTVVLDASELRNPTTNTYEYSVVSPILQNYSFKVNFTTTEFDITINNGSAGVHGDIKHEDDADFSNSPEQYITVYSGQSKRIWINAPENYRIESIYTDGVLIDDLNSDATSYTLVLNDIAASIRVDINYAAIILEIFVPDNLQNGEINYESTESMMGSSPFISVEAYEGYYIKTLTVNGIKVDPYHPGPGMSVSQLISVASVAQEEQPQPDNASGSVTADNDIRVTYYVLTFDFITTSKSISVQYAPVFYHVNVTSDGVGAVNFNHQTVAEGSTIYVTASTSTTYYVHSYTYTNPSGDFEVHEIVLTNVLQDANIMLQNIERDVDVNVVFKRCKYTVDFSNKEGDTPGEFATLSFIDDEVPITKTLPYTLQMEALTSKQFTVQAIDGYEIESILVQTETQVRESIPGLVLGSREDIAFHAKSHTLTLDSVETGYSITVVCKIASYKVELWLANAKDTYTIDGMPVSYKQVVLNHAQTYIANIVFDSQSSFEPNNLIVTGTSDEVKVSMNSNTEITLEISNITGNAEIIVLFNPLLDSQQPHNIIAKADAATGSLVALREVDVDGVKVLTSIDNGQVVENETVVLKATPIDSGYILKYLIVNGNVVHAATDNTYRIEHVGSDIYAEAVFAANVIPLVIDRRNVFGMVSSPVTSFVYGDQIPVRIVAATGHLVSYVAIGSRSNQNILDDTTLALFNASGAERVTDYMIDSNNYTYEQLREGLYVSVEFAPIVFNLSIALSGSGNVGQDYEAGIDKQINYGTVVNIPITADDNNFISSISVNGISYNPFELRYATINAAIQKCINGVLELTITEDISIEIGFSPNVYKATVVPAWGGTTLVRTEGGIYSDGTDLQLLAGQNLEIYMLADKEQGTHISELYINGELIRPEYWKLDLYSPNNNRSITYEYKGPNGSGITGNVHIKVVYEINTYTVAVNLKNKSLNFRTVNVNPTSFGTVTLKGLSAVSSEAVYDTDSYLMTVQTYNGIPHGSPVYFSFNPVTYDGYKIDLDTAVITYYDSADTTSSEAKVIALKALISEKGDTYVLPALNFDIESVYVEFVKEKYTYSLENTYNRMGSTYFPEVSEPIGITFTNPYLPDNEVIVEKIDNKDHYEYGLDFVIACVPGEGYTVSSFLVNEEDRVNAMKGNNYTGRIVASLNVIAEYSITTHRVSFTTNLTEGQLDANIGSLSIYSDDNQLLWEPGMSLSEVTLPILTSSGSVVDFNSGYITVTYNTIVSFVATPNYEDYGFKVDYFTINNSFQTISNPDAENVIEHTVTALARGFVNFSIHYYNVAVNYFEGGTGTVNGSASVQWDSDSAVILNIFAGYKLTAILVNGTADAGLLASAKKTTLNDASNQYELEILQIKSDKILTIETERLAYDLTFDGGFMEAFEVLGLLQDSVTGAVFNEGREEEIAYFSKPSAWSGSNPLSASTIETDPKRYVYSGYRYKDSVTLYFMPIDGYKIKNINITMRTVRGVVNTIVNNTDSLIVYDNRYGHYYYRINEATGAINVSVNYEIKNYSVVMSTSGRGNISKVELNDDIQSGSTVTIPRTVNHYDQITIEFIADYGYHLENLIINDRVIEGVQYQKVERVIDGVNKVVYWYTTNTTGGAQTARMIIDSVVINGRNRFSVEAEFAINTYEVRTFINGTETDYDNALTLSLSNSKMEYNSNYTIFQNITEGYSITDITFKNYVDYVICSYDYAYPAHSAVLKSAQLVFLPADVYVDHLDYHDDTGSNSMLFVYYNTIINTHTSIIDPYRYEYEKVGDDYLLVADPYGIPEVQKVTSGGTVNVPAYSLTRTYNNIEKGNDAIHNYNVDAKFRFFMEPAASDNYVFAGYQVYEDGIWRYINEDDTGFVLSSASVSPTGEAILDTLEYTIQSNRVFRAVVYRVYHVTVEIHPEYKWQSGTFSLTNFNMKYATYATLTARATFDSSMNPNLPDNSIVLADRDGTNDASYTYKVYSGAKLSLSLTDTKQAFYPVTGTQYYDITYNQNGHLVQTKRNYGTLNTVEIYSDRVVHAYANNDKMHLDIALETQGESVGAEGGSVKYYIYNESAGQFVSRTISNNALIMPTNTVVKLEITPKTSYRIDGVYQMESQNNPVDGYQVYIPDSWYKLANKPDNTLTITQMGDTMVVVMRLIENTVIKVKFWKQMEVTSSVNLLYGDTETVILNDEGPLGHLYFMQHSDNGIYDYEQDISYTVPNISELSRWDLRYQFIGYFVNGVNSFQQLDMNYPDSNSVTYRLYNFDAIERPDGVTMVRNSTDEIYKVNIVAKYVLLLNITFENEYAFDTQGGTVYFDPGYYRTEYTHYDPGYPIYYTETDYINASVETHTDKTIQMYAKINDISTLNIDGLQPTSSYNIWADNYILVNWYRSLDDNPNAEGFNFLEWQYYAYDGEGWSWQTLPDTDLADQNKPTNVTYQFSVASLIQNSYINHTMSPIDVSMYNEDNEFTGTEPIFTIKIRPLFQRKENINIQKVVYTEAYGIPNEEAAVYGPASIEDSGNTFGTYNFYDIVTLKPGSRSGFRFLGWYYSATGLENDYILVTHADASGEMTATRDYQLINYQEGSYGGDLRVRLTKDTVVKAVYIRIWNITVKVYNDSGSTAHMTDSAPNLDYYGVARLENGSYVYNTTPTQAMGRSQSLIMQAGEMAKFMMSFTGTGFNSDYDRYYSTNVIVEGVTQNWADTIEASRSENMPVKGESSTTVLDDATLIVTANQSKTIELVFRSYGKLQIDNIYPESAVVLPTQFYDAMVANATNNNWNENLVIDNGPIDEDSRTGYVLISDIPIKKEASSTYDGIFKNKLPQMDGDYAFTPISVSSFNINFSGAVIGGIYAKLQSFTYYNTTAGGSDGMSKMDMPFYVDGTTYGNGTLATPYKISTVNHLKSIDTFIASRGNTAAGVYFMLNNSIDVTSLFTGASPYNGIGKDIPFDGIFDGNGKNLYFGENVGIGAIPNFGIFRQTDAATIRNIKIGYSHTISLTANSSSIAGYLVGTANNSLIEDITTSTGRISIVGRSTVGGIVGRATGNTIIQDCIITCQMGVQAVEDSIGIVGGIAGALNNTSLVRNINIDGILQLTAKRYIGAIAGKVDGDTSTAIDNCQTYLPRVADISYQAIGGIVGYNGANRGVEDCSIKGESTAMTFYSGTFTTFNSSTLSNYGTAGGGLIAGINLGTLKNCNISNLPSIKMVGAFCGGIVGVNTGRVDDCDSASVYITTEKNMANSGGTYGAIVGYNIGEIRNANIKGAANNTMNFTNCNYAIKSHTYSPSPFQTSGVNPSVVTPVSDGGYIYLGGFAGYNGSGGKIVSCVATGAKMLINRWARNDTNNYTYNGILAGYNNSGNSSSTGNSITNSSALIYACVAVDNGSASTNGSTSYNYLGDIYGYNTSGGVYSSGSGNRLRLTVVGIGSVFTNWKIYATSEWTTNDKRGVNGRDYRTGKIHYAITRSSGSTQYFVRQCNTTDLHSLSGRETATNYYWTGSWFSLRLRSETIYRYPLYLRYLNIV